MNGKVIQFRRGRKNYTPRHFLIEVDGVSKRADAEKLVGKEVIWTSEGKEKKEIKGKIAGAHGNKGLVRVIFERGLPGQALTQEVKVK